MELPAKRSVRSLKDMLVEVAMITVGVLIALSFDGLRTWRHDRELVREARANITNELTDNRKELAGALSRIKSDTDEIVHALGLVEKVAKTKTLENQSASLHFGLANLQSVSRTTAEVTGALALMDYEEVKRYSSIYSLQTEFLRMQSDGVAQITRAMSLVDVFAEPAQATPRELEDLTSYLRLSGASLFSLSQLGAELVKAYDVALAGARE